MLRAYTKDLSEPFQYIFRSYSCGVWIPDKQDPFSEILLSPDFGELSDPLLKICMILYRVSSQSLYRHC